MKINSIYRIIEAARKGRVEQCLRYCSKIYDYIEKEPSDSDKETFLTCCKSYFYPESTGWATQDEGEHLSLMNKNYNECIHEKRSKTKDSRLRRLYC